MKRTRLSCFRFSSFFEWTHTPSTCKCRTYQYGMALRTTNSLSSACGRVNTINSHSLGGIPFFKFSQLLPWKICSLNILSVSFCTHGGLFTCYILMVRVYATGATCSDLFSSWWQNKPTLKFEKANGHHIWKLKRKRTTTKSYATLFIVIEWQNIFVKLMCHYSIVQHLEPQRYTRRKRRRSTGHSSWKRRFWIEIIVDITIEKAPTVAKCGSTVYWPHTCPPILFAVTCNARRWHVYGFKRIEDDLILVRISVTWRSSCSYFFTSSRF